MQRLTNFLKQVFAAPEGQELPAIPTEMTFHDVLRLCASHMQNDDRPALIPPPSIAQSGELNFLVKALEKMGL